MTVADEEDDELGKETDEEPPCPPIRQVRSSEVGIRKDQAFVGSAETTMEIDQPAKIAAYRKPGRLPDFWFGLVRPQLLRGRLEVMVEVGGDQPHSRGRFEEALEIPVKSGRSRVSGGEDFSRSVVNAHALGHKLAEVPIEPVFLVPSELIP